jgi:predicted O-methyltransferase YrrM
MPEKAVALEAGLYEYIVQRFAKDERELLRTMEAAARHEGLRAIQISEEQAKFIAVLVKAARVKRALDVGTLFGYSAAVMARAMPKGGTVVTLELDPLAARAARRNFRLLGLTKQVDLHEGKALDLMRAMRASTFDLVLIDADKHNYENYLEEAIRLLKDGGIVLVDNTFAFGQILQRKPERGGEVKIIQRFNDRLSAHPRVESVLVPVGDGLAFGIVHKSGRAHGRKP